MTGETNPNRQDQARCSRSVPRADSGQPCPFVRQRHARHSVVHPSVCPCRGHRLSGRARLDIERQDVQRVHPGDHVLPAEVPAAPRGDVAGRAGTPRVVQGLRRSRAQGDRVARAGGGGATRVRPLARLSLRLALLAFRTLVLGRFVRNRIRRASELATLELAVPGGVRVRDLKLGWLRRRSRSESRSVSVGGVDGDPPSAARGRAGDLQAFRDERLGL